MAGDKPAGAIAGVAAVLAACCGLHVVLLAVGGITVAGLRFGWTVAFGALIVLALVVLRFRRDRCRVPPQRRDGREGSYDASGSRTD